MSDRPKGVVVYRSPKNPIADAAKEHERQREQKRQEAAAARAARPVPNYLCYAVAFKGRVDEHGNWLGGRLPKCLKCKGLLEPKDNHQCPGYIPDPMRLNTEIDPETRMAMRRASWDDWDDAQYDPTTPGDADWMMHEAETGETRDQVVIEGMTEEEWFMRKFGYIP